MIRGGWRPSPRPAPTTTDSDADGDAGPGTVAVYTTRRPDEQG